MPRQAKYLEVFRESLNYSCVKDCLIDKNQKLVHPDSKNAYVVLKIRNFIKSKGFEVSSNAIYTRIKKAAIWDDLFEKKTENNQENESLKKTILISQESYERIRLEKKIVNGKTRTYPIQGWTTELHRLLSTEWNVPCTYKFKFISVKDVFCSAICPECSMTLELTLLTSDQQKQLQVKITQFPDEKIEHTKSRQLRGELRSLDPKISALTHFNNEKLANKGKKGKIIRIFKMI